MPQFLVKPIATWLTNTFAAGSAAAAAGKVAAWASVTANIVVTAGTMAVANMLMPKVDFGNAATRRSLNVRGANQRNATTNRQYIYGQVKVGGTVAYMGTSDKTAGDNAYLHMVLVHCDHEVEELGDLYVNGELVEMASGGEGVLRTTSSTSDRYYQSLYIADHLGGPGQTAADSTLDAATGDINSSDAFKGMAYTYIRMELKQPSEANPDEENAFPSGIPQFQRVVKGMKVYDPREAGHDPDDSTTWEYSPNWALCVGHFLQSDFGYGRYGLTYDEINETELIASANNSDEAISEYWKAWQANETLETGGFSRSLGGFVLYSGTTTGTTGASAPDLTGLVVGDTVVDNDITWTLRSTDTNTANRYELNGMVDSSEDPIEVLRKMRTAASGMVEYVGGEWIVRSGRYIAPTITLSESDFSSGISGTTKDDRTGHINTVKGVIVDKHDSYQVVDAPSITNATFVTEDGGVESVREMELMFTNSHKTAQRLFKVELNKARQSITHKASFTSKAMQLQVGDTFQLNFSKYGYVNKVFEVMEHHLIVSDGALSVEMTFRETASNVYDWDHTTDETATDPAPNTTLPSPFDVPTGPTPTITSGTSTLVQTADGTINPTMHVDWTPVADINVIAYELRWERFLNQYEYMTINGRESSTAVIGGVVEGSTYGVQIRCITPLKIGKWGTNVDHDVVGKSAAPSTPTGFSASPIIEGVSLTMDTHPDIDFKRFLIYQNTSNTQPATHSYTTTDTTKTINGLSAGTPYYFWLEAEDTTDHTSSATSSVTATPDASDTGPQGPAGDDAVGLIIPSYFEQVNANYDDYDPVGKTITPTVLLGDNTVSYSATASNNTWRYKTGLTYTGGTAATTTGTGGLGFATHTDGVSKLEVSGVIIYRNASAAETELDFTAQWVLSGQGVVGPTGPTGPAGADGTNGTNGTDGTDGVDATLEHSGLIYYTTPQATAPATPSATSYTFSTRTFAGLTSGWQTTPVEVELTDTTTKHWTARYDVTESSANSDSGTPSFTAPVGSINFGATIQSDNFDASNGWQLNRDTDTLTVNDGVFRGEIEIGTGDQQTYIDGSILSFGDRAFFERPAANQARLVVQSELSTGWPPPLAGTRVTVDQDEIEVLRFASGADNFTTNITGDRIIVQNNISSQLNFVRIDDTAITAGNVNAGENISITPGTGVRVGGLIGNDMLITDDPTTGIIWGDDANGANLYKSASNILKTDDSFEIGDDLRFASNPGLIYNTSTAGEIVLYGGTEGNGANIHLTGSAHAGTSGMYLDADGHNFRKADASRTLMSISDAGNGTAVINIKGGSTGNEGGEIRIEANDDHDTTYDYYFLDAYQDDMRIGRAGRVDMTLRASGNLSLAHNSSYPTDEGRLNIRGDGLNEVGLFFQVDLGTNVRDCRLIGPSADNVNAPFRFFTNNTWNFDVDSYTVLDLDVNYNVVIGGSAGGGGKLQFENYTSTDGHIQLYNGTAASGYALGVESSTLYYRANGVHRWYINSLANGGTSGDMMNLSSTRLQVDGLVQTKGYTVSTLPSGTAGDRAHVTDATSTTFMTTVVGGGSNTVPVFYDGTNWKIG